MTASPERKPGEPLTVRAEYAQAVDWRAEHGMVLSLHSSTGVVAWMLLDEDTWETLKQHGDDALAIGTGAASPRTGDDPDRFRGVPIHPGCDRG